jgi:hypothetical protein
MDKVAARDPEAIEELDAMDQIGSAVIEAARLTSPRTTTARRPGPSRPAPVQDAEKAQDGHAVRRQDGGLHRRPGALDA